MNIKILLYIMFIPLCIWMMLSLKIEHLFKNGNINQIKVFYFVMSLVISYLLVNFVFDIYEVAKIVS